MILKGKIRRELQSYIAYQWAQWELEWENSPLYQRERERDPRLKIEELGREQIARRIPAEYHGKTLRENGYLRVEISGAFIKETRQRMARWKRDIVEFDQEDWKKRSVSCSER